MYMPSTMPSPPGVIGITAKTLARPNATSRASMSSVPPKARRKTHSDAASSSQLSVAQRTTRLSSGRSATRSSSRSPIWRRARRGRRIEAQLAAEPAQEALGPALAVLQADDEQGDDDHDPEAEQRRRDVQRVDAADRDRHEQRRQKMRLSTTADPRPAVARAKPASGPLTPDSVISR